MDYPRVCGQSHWHSDTDGTPYLIVDVSPTESHYFKPVKSVPLPDFIQGRANKTMVMLDGKIYQKDLKW